ncbi:MAG: 3-alpha-hydroxysteroid dehydrogenase [Acidobacteria bacterium]|nr:MAG: 3-alpha-hydroxysteroid dehydrogenase [Acidobacteriota bacterium]
MAGRLDGKVALITGGARGMGAEEVRLFASEGAGVLATDVLDQEGEALAAELGDAVRYLHADVTSEDDWSKAVAAAVEEFGHLDVLINNAGIVKLSPIATCSLDDYMSVINVNQVGVFLGIKSVIPAMASKRSGSIVNISSVEGLAASPWVVSYVASKFAVRGMTKCAALELGGLGIRVNSIHPGGIRTDMIKPGGIDVTGVFEKVPLGRVGEPGEVAGLALWLASDESAYCTGSEFVIDGGLMAGISVSTDDLSP